MNPIQAPTSQTNQTSKRTALLVATAAAFLTPYMGSSVNVALPTIGRDLALDAVTLGWVAMSYLLAAAMFLLPVGRWSDIYGRKRTFFVGLLVYALGSLLSGLAPSGTTLLAARALQGMGGAMIFGTNVAILTSVFPAAERGKVLGINVAAVYTGLATGPFLGGLLTEHLGWRSVFIVNTPVALAAAVLVAAKLRGEWAEASGERFDLMGSVLYSLALVALMYGLSHVPQAAGTWLAVSGACGFVVFGLWERSTEGPLLDVNLLTHNRTFAFSNLAALINYSSTAASGFLLSLYLRYPKGLSPTETGTILLCQPVVMALLSPLAGRLSDRIEPRLIASAGMALTAAGLGSLNLLNANSSWQSVVGCLVLLGFGFAFFSSPNTNAIMSSVDRRLYGVASATTGTMRLVGGVLSMSIATLMLSAFIGRNQITPENYDLFLKCARASFTLFAVLCTAGIFASLARGRLR